MSDNLFADLFDSFKRGWEGALTAESFPAHSVRSRPSFWNPFRTWRDQEQRDLRALYEKVGTAFRASPFADREFLDATVERAIVAACNIAECTPPRETLRAVYSAVKELIEDEFFLFTEFDGKDWHKHVGLEEAQRIKRTLERKGRFLEDADRLYEIGCARIALIFGSLLDFLPESFRDAVEEGDGPRSMTFDVDLIDMVDRPAAAVEGTLVTLFDKDLREGGLFDGPRAQLEHNFYVASGQDPSDKTVSIKQMIMPTAAKGKTPAELAELYLGETPFADFFGYPLPFDIPERSRLEHCHILGGTGHGKTQCLQYLLHADLVRARESPMSIVVIDSQGDLIRKLSSSALLDRDADGSLADRFVLIDPSDIETPPALNLFDPGLERLEGYDARQRELAFNSLVDIYGRFFGALLGAELTARQASVFRYLARLMLTIEGATIHTMIALMDDIGPFREHIGKLDATARRFLENEFAQKGFYPTRQQIKQRLYAVLSIPTFDRLFSAPRSRFSFFDALNAGKIVLITTAKDLLKSDGTAIFGRFILALIEHAVMERATLAEDMRTPVFVYMDEAQDYFDDTVETLLVEARKYNCGLTLAHQNLAQLSPRLRAIFQGNTTIKLAGGVTDQDARALAGDMRATPEFLLSMRKRNDRSEFALSVRNLTPHGIKVSVPLGFLESQPTLESDQRAALLQANRERVGYTPALEEISAEDEASHLQVPVSEPEPGLEPTLRDAAEPEPAAPTTAEPAVGHRRLQERIKRAAQRREFAATIEMPVLDGAGSIDVAIEREGIRIACEISVTTKPDHELHNIEKCLAAGYGEVWVTSPDPAHLETLRTALAGSLPVAARGQVHFIEPSEIVARLDDLGKARPRTQSTVLGYVVESEQLRVTSAQAQDRRQRLAAILDGAGRRTGPRG